MFLRATKRKKDGKIHHYWSVVENVRVGRRVFQRRALYLGELNDSQHAEWQRAIEAIDENGLRTQRPPFSHNLWTTHQICGQMVDGQRKVPFPNHPSVPREAGFRVFRGS